MQVEPGQMMLRNVQLEPVRAAASVPEVSVQIEPVKATAPHHVLKNRPQGRSVHRKGAQLLGDVQFELRETAPFPYRKPDVQFDPLATAPFPPVQTQPQATAPFPLAKDVQFEPLATAQPLQSSPASLSSSSHYPHLLTYLSSFYPLHVAFAPSLPSPASSRASSSPHLGPSC